MKIDWDNREWLALDAEMAVLERFATQPGNYRSRKPARLVWLYTLGEAREKILADLKVSETTLERWFERWINYGVSGLTKFSHPELNLYA